MHRRTLLSWGFGYPQLCLCGKKRKLGPAKSWSHPFFPSSECVDGSPSMEWPVCMYWDVSHCQVLTGSVVTVTTFPAVTGPGPRAETAAIIDNTHLITTPAPTRSVVQYWIIFSTENQNISGRAWRGLPITSRGRCLEVSCWYPPTWTSWTRQNSSHSWILSTSSLYQLLPLTQVHIESQSLITHKPWFRISAFIDQLWIERKEIIKYRFF